tara:strand:+ start:7728 stop:8966 length:1239 start_codon:yes stop_codon:yes gene_type:complete
MEKGHYGEYSGNARHSRVTSSNYKASERDDAAHIDYLKRDVNYDAKHGHSNIDMTADEKHISKLAGDMKYDKKHHGMSRESSRAERLRKRAMKRSERIGSEMGDYDYEDKKVQNMLSKARKLDERTGEGMAEGMSERMRRNKEYGGMNRMTGHGQSKGDQSATHLDYAHYKGTDKGYHGHSGASHGDQSATRKDYMGMSRMASPLYNTGWGGFNYNKGSAELDYMPIEDDMHRGMSRHTSEHSTEEYMDRKDAAIKKSQKGMSRESSELKDMPIVDIEKGDAKGDTTKYKKVINKAMMEKATKAEVSAKLRNMFPEVKNNSVEVNWSPDGKKVEVYKKKSYTKELKAIPKKKASSPLNAKGDKCPESGCVQEKGNGKWGVISGKTGKWWNANYDSRSSAEAGLRAYFANGGN